MDNLKQFNVMASEDNWQTTTFRQSVVAKIEEVIQRSGMQVARNSSEMENYVFAKATNRDEYMNMVAKLILHVREMCPPKPPVPAPGNSQQPTPDSSQQRAPKLPETSQKPAPKLSHQTAPEPSHPPAPKPSQQPASRPLHQPAPELSHQPVPESSQQPAPDLSHQPAPEPSKQPAPEPSQQRASRPLHQPVLLRSTRRQAVSPRRPRATRLRARRNLGQTAFARAASQLVAVEQRRLRMEEVRERMLHEREMEHLRVEGMKLEAAREQNRLLRQLTHIMEELFERLCQYN